MLSDPKVFLLVHVLLSLAGIVAGLVVVGGFMAGQFFRRWIAVFLVTTVLTSGTGFGFPFVKVLPSHIVGALSLLILLGAIAALYWKRLEGAWRSVFVSLSVAALYLSVFVLVAQLFQKIPAMALLAPTPAAPVFGATQAATLVVFAGIGWVSVKAFRQANLEI